MTISTFIEDKIILDDIDEFKTFFRALTNSDDYYIDAKYIKIHVYQRLVFIFEDSKGIYRLQIGNMLYSGILEEMEFRLFLWYRTECKVDPLKCKTGIPKRISSVRAARAFLKELDGNGEAFDPFDDPGAVLSGHNLLFSPGDAALMRRAMKQILSISNFNPHQYLLNLFKRRYFLAIKNMHILIGSIFNMDIY